MVPSSSLSPSRNPAAFSPSCRWLSCDQGGDPNPTDCLKNDTAAPASRSSSRLIDFPSRDDDDDDDASNRFEEVSRFLRFPRFPMQACGCSRWCFFPISVRTLATGVVLCLHFALVTRPSTKLGSRLLFSGSRWLLGWLEWNGNPGAVCRCRRR